MKITRWNEPGGLRLASSLHSVLGVGEGGLKGRLMSRATALLTL